jgi:hypothetical protein
VSKQSVFISHAHATDDAVWLKDFVKNLEGYGLEVWFDESGIELEADIADSIERALRESDVLVTLFDEAHSFKPNLFFELGAALASKKRIVTIVPDHFDISTLPAALRKRPLVRQHSPEDTAQAVATAALS